MICERFGSRSRQQPAGCRPARVVTMD